MLLKALCGLVRDFEKSGGHIALADGNFGHGRNRKSNGWLEASKSGKPKISEPAGLFVPNEQGPFRLVPTNSSNSDNT